MEIHAILDFLIIDFQTETSQPEILLLCTYNLNIKIINFLVKKLTDVFTYRIELYPYM
jgi:hypothetical protein